MKTSIDLELRRHVARYAAGRISLAELRERIAPLIWSVEEYHDRSAEQLAHDLALYFAEFSHGDWTEDELRAELAALHAPPSEQTPIPPS